MRNCARGCRQVERPHAKSILTPGPSARGSRNCSASAKAPFDALRRRCIAMIRLIRNLIRPYRRSLAVVLAAMLVETLMSLATPWPLKVVLDNVVGGNRLPHWLSGFLGAMPGRRQDANRLVGRRRVCRDCRDRSRGFLHRQLHERKRVAGSGARPAHAHLSPSAAALARLLRSAQGRRIAQHAHFRYRYHSELRLFRNAGHPRRHPRGLRNVPADVLAELGFRPAGGGSGALLALVRFQASRKR